MKLYSRLNSLACCVTMLLVSDFAFAQRPHAAPPPHNTHVKAKESPAPGARPKLVVLIVVDQMRGDYVDKFKGQWTGGLKRLLDEGAWFREAAYPYAATETCVGHATISTGAFPANHGMIANAWWDRDSQKMVTCTFDPNVKNIGYPAGEASTDEGGDSASRMRVPAMAPTSAPRVRPATKHRDGGVATFHFQVSGAV